MRTNKRHSMSAVESIVASRDFNSDATRAHPVTGCRLCITTPAWMERGVHVLCAGDPTATTSLHWLRARARRLFSKRVQFKVTVCYAIKVLSNAHLTPSTPSFVCTPYSRGSHPSLFPRQPQPQATVAPPKSQSLTSRLSWVSAGASCGRNTFFGMWNSTTGAFFTSLPTSASKSWPTNQYFRAAAFSQEALTLA